MTTTKIKHIKLQPKHRELQSGNKIVPWLTVSGAWLEENGFKAGQSVTIIVKKNKLIIKPL